MKKLISFFFTLGFIIAFGTSQAALLTFDGLASGETSFSVDVNNNGIFDATFSTTDPFGFKTMGPGSNMAYIDEPGLEGSTLVNEPGLEGSTSYDLRVDFGEGAVGGITFGFALDDFSESTDSWVKFSVYDNDSLLVSVEQNAYYTYLDATNANPSSFPEGLIDVQFVGTAYYALFDFNNDISGGQRYIIDNFRFDVPEPSTIALFGVGISGFGFARRRKLRQS